MDFKQFLEIKENKNKGIPKIAKIPKIVSIEYTMLIDSRDRDRSVYLNTNNFVVKINSNTNVNATINYRYKNITDLILSSVVLPKRVTSYPYLILEIPELSDSKIQGTNQSLNKAFAIMIPEHHDNQGDFVNCTVNYLDNHRHHFDPPRTGLPNSLTFIIKEPNGTLANLGTDNALPLAVKDTVQVFFLFKVKCDETDLHELKPNIVH